MGLFNKKHSIGKTIAELRKEKGWTQVELAEKLQVSDKAISKWEQDSGAPSIDFFPALAEVFGVSIDYLMTGKMVEPDIITMSKIELCAKTDDVALFESLPYEVLKNNDDEGKTILDYMMQYNCKKVIDAFFEKYSAKFILANNVSRNGCSYWYTEKVLRILIVNNKIDELTSIGAFVRNTNRTESNNTIFSENWCKLILTSSSVNKELKLLYFCAMTSKEIDTALRMAVENEKEKDIYIIWDLICQINDKNIKAKQQKEKEVAGTYMTYVRYSSVPCREYEAIGTSRNYSYFVIGISEPTLQILLDKGYIDIVRKAQEYSIAIGGKGINEEMIQAAELKKNGGSPEQIKILSVLKDGIVQIDKLLESKDLKFVKTILNEYPIHLIEKIIAYYHKEDWKKLFEFAIDNNDNSLADCIIRGNKVDIEKQVLSYWDGNRADVSNINWKHFYIMQNGREFPLIKRTYGGAVRSAKNFEDVLDKIQLVKQRIIDELSLKLDKGKIVGDLTKEYFESELAKGNTDMVIIKLCVRLEAILRCDCHLEGDFSDMLNRYCSRFETYDDESNNYDPYTPRKLNKLRMQRNGIVHSEKCKETLTLDELKWCIDYICKLG